MRRLKRPINLALGFLIGERLAHSRPVNAAGLTAMRQHVEDNFEAAATAISDLDHGGEPVSDEVIEQLGLQVAMDIMTESLRRDKEEPQGYGGVPSAGPATQSTKTPRKAISMNARTDSKSQDDHNGRKNLRTETARGNERMTLPLIIDALAFASHAHRDQRRKGVEASPYISHPIALARILAVEGGVDD